MKSISAIATAIVVTVISVTPIPFVTSFSYHGGNSHAITTISTPWKYAGVTRSSSSPLHRTSLALFASSSSSTTTTTTTTSRDDGSSGASVIVDGRRRALPSWWTVVALSWTVVVAAAAPAVAVTDFPAVLNGDYVDPSHPRCERHVRVRADGRSLRYEGTEGAIGRCTPREVRAGAVRDEAFDGTIGRQQQGGNDDRTVTIDGLARRGVWEEGTAVDRSQDGIRWSDGTKWTKLPSNNNNGNGNMNPVAAKALQWVFLLYTVFSLAAGAKEMTVRLRNKLNDTD